MKFKLIVEDDSFEVEKGDKNESVVTIPSVYKGKNVTRIGAYAFEKAKLLEKINIPEGITSIETGAFSQCKKLSHVDLPESLKIIEDYAFLNCEELKSISLPKELKKIGDNCFYKTSIVNIKLPTSLQKIGSEAFAYCEQLNAITIPEKVTILEEKLFYGCINLKTVTLHQGIKKIKKSCFEKCESLEVKSNFLPNSINELPDDIFSGCKNLKSLDLHNSIKSIGKNSFYGCKNLEKINIPLEVTSIPESCFSFCESLKTIFLHDGIKSIEKDAFFNCGFKKIKLPKLIEVIEKGTFNLCGELEEVILPPNLKKIKENAFSMTNIKHIQFPSSLEVIEKDAFSLIFDINIPFLPNDFIKIDKKAFSELTNVPDEVDPNFKSSTKKSSLKNNTVKKPNAKLPIDTNDAKNFNEFIDSLIRQFRTLDFNELLNEGEALFSMVKSQYNKLSETISGVGLDFFVTYFADLTEDESLIDQEKKYLQHAIFEGKTQFATMVDNLQLFKTSRLHETFEYLNSTMIETMDNELEKQIMLLFFYHFLLGVVFCSIKGNPTKSQKGVLEKYLFLDLDLSKKIFNIYKRVSPLAN